MTYPKLFKLLSLVTVSCTLTNPQSGSEWNMDNLSLRTLENRLASGKEVFCLTVQSCHWLSPLLTLFIPPIKANSLLLDLWDACRSYYQSTLPILSISLWLRKFFWIKPLLRWVQSGFFWQSLFLRILLLELFWSSSCTYFQGEILRITLNLWI